MSYIFLLVAITSCTIIGVQSNILPVKDLPIGDGRIISGNPAVLGQFPWQVAVHFTRGSGNYFCGGSLISDQWVLTAAHCAEGNQNFTLRFGGVTLNDVEEGRVDIAATTHIVHSGYNANLHNDIALVKLDAPITFNGRIKPVKLPARGQVVGAGKKVTVSGWGRTSDTSPGVSKTLNYVEITTISNEECYKTYGNGIVVDSTVCVVGNPEHGTCNGDSGGPLVVYENDEATQVGIVSFGHIDGCATEHPSGFVRVEHNLDWIKEHTGLNV